MAGSGLFPFTDEHESIRQAARNFAQKEIAPIAAEFDDTGEFKAWHDVLKGGHSSYELERIERGAPSRKRKCAFEIDHIEAIFFNNQKELNEGINEHWITFFQEGMRNANGRPRRSKYALWTTKAPEKIRPISPIVI